MKRARKPPGPKKVAYTLITREDQPTMYKLLDKLVKAHHTDLKDARIALAWCTSWKPDVDGRQTLGKCKRASDLDRELAPLDFVILLNQDYWQNEAIPNEHKTALLDHELMHAAVKLDRFGEPVEDVRGRKVYRLRRHDLEEFSDIAARHGLWKKDIEHFAQALRRHESGHQATLPIGHAATGAVTHTH
jgi:Putative phage metallopeptidase